MDSGTRGKRPIGASLAVVAAAVIGGAAALGGASALGQLGTQTTVKQIITPTSNAPVRFATGKALSIHDIYRRWSSGVVQITSTSVVQVPQDPLFGNPFASPTQEQQSLGSGFVIDKAGHIVTNYHVIEGAKTVNVSFSNGDNVKAHIVGSDPSTDIAVLQVSTHSRAR